jgi:hypothetical protein
VDFQIRPPLSHSLSLSLSFSFSLFFAFFALLRVLCVQKISYIVYIAKNYIYINKFHADLFTAHFALRTIIRSRSRLPLYHAHFALSHFALSSALALAYRSTMALRTNFRSLSLSLSLSSLTLVVSAYLHSAYITFLPVFPSHPAEGQNCCSRRSC